LSERHAVKLLRVVGGTIFLVGVLLPACRRARLNNPLENVKVEGWQTAQAVDAVSRLREGFNNSSCEPIYTAAAAKFRTQDAREWTTECDKLKQQLGSWRSFQITGTQRCAMPQVVVCVGGPAEFEKGRADIDTAWLLTKSGPKLFWIAVKENERHWKLIPPTPLLHRLIDPLPIKAIQNGRPS
jgi:hypothetical protein